MEEKRGGDILICSIYSLLLVCLTGGGSCLLIHMLSDDPQEWHLVAGMALVGVPWCFWISTCAYTCVKHTCTCFIIMQQHPNPEYPPSTNANTKATTMPTLQPISNYDRLSLHSPKLPNRSSTDSNSPMDISITSASDGDNFSGVIVLGDHLDTHAHAHANSL